MWSKLNFERTLTNAPTLLRHLDRPNLRGVNEIARLNSVIMKALKFELNRTHKSAFKQEISVFDSLMEKLPQLKEISSLHMESLSAFRKTNPIIVFPPLHKELFSVDH